ncbi:Mis6-domain-containing protein [Lojkania enalia]|uniref:Mis6-domain-containing protein n=1 Tax=Lojkania enalia TaxID=147567 RepID=A0A9P4KJR2_9PLEO|nr:Mis6-domain-containing protein [Didymosphaeria enalia]
MRQVEERGTSLHDAVEALERASRLPAKQRFTKVSGIVDVICHHAFNDGLNADVLQDVVQIVTRKTELDQTSVTTLIKNLYPAQRVSADVVITVVGGLGQGKGKPSLATQNALVKWLAIVHSVIEDVKVLSRLYGVLFGMLDMISIRTSLCHLLSLITRRRHVKPFRIQQLLELSRGLGNEPALQGLLRIYKDYYPDIILGSTAMSRNSFPPRPDSEWRTRLLSIQESSTAMDSPLSQQQNGFRVLRKGAKRSKVSVIPDVHTFRAQETSVTLEEIDNVEDFVERLDSIEPPGQMISSLVDPLLQKFVDLRPSEITSTRIDLWLSTCLEEEFNIAQYGVETSANLSEILQGLYRQTQYTKSILPVVSTFLQAYLPIWDGINDLDMILGLLSYVPLQPFEDVYATYLGPVERAVAIRNINSCAKLIVFYAEMLRHWAMLVTPQSSASVQPALNSNDQQNLGKLIDHVAKLAESILLSSAPQDCFPVESATLLFYEILSSSSKPRMVPIVIPPLHLTYMLAQSPSATTLSRLCGVFKDYKVAFEKHPRPLSAFYPASTTNVFNQCVKDIYNSIWVAKALVADKNKNMAGLYCAPPLREALGTYLQSVDGEYAISKAFLPSYNPLFASLAAAAWRTLEDTEIKEKGYDRDMVLWHKGPVSQLSLDVLGKRGGVVIGWDMYKLRVLAWLAARGCGGIRDLMFVTAKELKA